MIASENLYFSKTICLADIPLCAPLTVSIENHANLYGTY